MAQNRRMCNELVHELCKEITTVKTSDSILLTAYIMYAYLAPRFNKRLIYRDAIAFLKANLNAKKWFAIRIDQVVQNNECEPIVVINQEQSVDKFKMETNQFRVGICNGISVLLEPRAILIPACQFENVHLPHFLRLIAPLLHPIRLYLDSSRIRIDLLGRFMNTQSDWIDSIGLLGHQFNSEPIYGALSKYNKLQVIGHLNPVNVAKMIQWLTSNNNDNNNNNGQTKKYLFLGHYWINHGLALLELIEEVKKEFVCATNKRRFVVRFGLNDEHLDEFTLGNELTGERLELRHKKNKIKFEQYAKYIHALSRSPDNGLEEDNNENDSAELDTYDYETEINLL